jgi:branched-subunit amino acid ABC-type transport system permease component
MTTLGRAGTSPWKLLALLLGLAVWWPAVAGAQEGEPTGEDPAPVEGAPESTVTTDVPGGADTTDAGDAPTFTVFGSLNVLSEGTRQPVEGVTITVFDQAGGLVEEVESDENGRWSVEVDEPTTYLVELDVDTLPDGVRVAPNGVEERTVSLAGGRDRIGALCPLEAGDAEADAAPASSGGRSETERFLQLLVEGIRFGLLLGLMAIGLSLIFGTTGLTNFAHAEMVTFGAIAAYFFNVSVGLHVIPAFVLAAIAGALGGALLDSAIFRPLRRRGTSLIAQLVVTIGLSILLRYFFLYIFRGDRRSYEQYAVQGGIELGPVNATPKDLWTIAICILLLGGVGLLLQRTRTGRAMRAVADNRDLASSSGINVERVILQVWVLGGGLAALSGALFGLSESIYWEMGFRILLLIFAGVTLGGLGTAFGAAVGSLIIGIFVMVSTMVIPAELKNVGALAVLILVLVVRPQGILGRSERIG